MVKKKNLGIIIMFIGYFLLILGIIKFVYDLEYKLAFEEKSILHISLLDNFANINSLIMVWVIIMIIFIGYLTYSNVLTLEKIKRMLKNILKSLLFIFEVILASMIIYLVVLWKHLSEKVNIGYLIAIIFSIILR